MKITAPTIRFRLITFLLGTLGSLALNVCLFLAIFRLTGPRHLRWSAHLPGAVWGGLGWQLLQMVGQSLVRHNLRHLAPLYGQFAIVLGLISFLSIASQLMMYSVEINVVRAKHLWPRSILNPPRLPADDRVLAAQAAQEVRVRGEQIEVRLPRVDTAG